MSSKAPFGFLVLSGAFLILDRFFKWQALHAWNAAHPWTKFMGWEPFLNKGIAFGIMLPLYVIVLLTLFIIAGVFYFFYLQLRLSPSAGRQSAALGLTLIITGAVSNLADRVLYGQTVDYFRIFMSVVNFADSFIVVGFVLYFSSLKYLK